MRELSEIEREISRELHRAIRLGMPVGDALRRLYAERESAPETSAAITLRVTPETLKRLIAGLWRGNEDELAESLQNYAEAGATMIDLAEGL